MTRRRQNQRKKKEELQPTAGENIRVERGEDDGESIRPARAASAHHSTVAQTDALTGCLTVALAAAVLTVLTVALNVAWTLHRPL